MTKSSVLKLSFALLMSLSIAACQSGADKQDPEPTTSSPKKIGGPEEGGLFSSVFKRKQPSAIVLPPDLVSSANETVKENHEAGTESRAAVLPEIIGAKVVEADGRRWLRVDSDAQKVWDKLASFWAEEEIELVEFKPAAGLMETDWIETGARSERDKKRNLANLFDRITGKNTAFDKYKIRLEREGDDVTNIYVSHRSTERVESEFNSPSKITQYDWVEKESDPEKVAELLQVMVLIFQSGDAGNV